MTRLENKVCTDKNKKLGLQVKIHSLIQKNVYISIILVRIDRIGDIIKNFLKRKFIDFQATIFLFIVIGTGTVASAAILLSEITYISVKNFKTKKNSISNPDGTIQIQECLELDEFDSKDKIEIGQINGLKDVEEENDYIDYSFDENNVSEEGLKEQKLMTHDICCSSKYMKNNEI